MSDISTITAVPVELGWVQEIRTVVATDTAAVDELAADPRWRLLAAGRDPDGQTTLTFAAPDPDAPGCSCYSVAGSDPRCPVHR